MQGRGGAGRNQPAGRAAHEGEKLALSSSGSFSCPPVTSFLSYLSHSLPEIEEKRKRKRKRHTKAFVLCVWKSSLSDNDDGGGQFQDPGYQPWLYTRPVS